MSGILDQIYESLFAFERSFIYSHLVMKLSRVILKSWRIPIGYIVNWGVLECGRFPIGYIVNWGVLEYGKLTG